MPEFACVSQADGLAVFNDVGDDQDFRVVGQQELFEHMDLQHAESTAEVDLLLGSDTLITENHDMMVQVRTMNAHEIFVVDRTGQIEADDLGTAVGGAGETSGGAGADWCVDGGVEPC